MDISFLLSQIFIGIAFLSDFASFQFKDRKKILLFLCISSILISAHYFLLDKETAGVLVLISALRYITSYYSTHKIFMFALIGIGVIGFIGTYSSPASFFMFGSMLLFTIGAFQKKDKFLRLLIMTGTILVITYNVIIFSPMAIFLESFFLVSNIFGYYRFYIQENS
jgi:hypothetical protein